MPDPALSGLYLVIQPSGAKSWALRYRYGGKPAKLTLGPLAAHGAGRRAAAASEAMAKVERGKNPADEKKAAKAAKVRRNVDRDKVKTLVGQFDQRHLSTFAAARWSGGNWSASWWRNGASATFTHHQARRDRPPRRDRGQRARGDGQPRPGLPRQVPELVRGARRYRGLARRSASSRWRRRPAATAC